jgi:ABC-type Fe3+-hydroxamate transport system substrate-binding protein
VTPVGVTRFCEHPELPAVGGTKDPDLEAVLRLRPDLVVVNDEENRRQDADALTAAGVDVHVVRINRLADVGPELAALAGRVQVRTSPAPDLPEQVPPGRSAFVPIWRRPWMSLAGTTYGSSVLAWLGVVNVFADAATRYPEVTLEEASRRRPDLVLAPSEPYPFGPRHVPELSAVAPVRLVDGQDLFWWGVRTPAALARLAAALGADA